MRVLVVEDERRLLRALAQLLRDSNYTVDTADDGLDGQRQALENTYDVIVLDVMLPGRSGYDIVRTLRKEGLSTPILLLTAKDAVRDRVEGLDCGADDYLVKPFATQELLARVRALTRRTGEVIGAESYEVGPFVMDSVHRAISLHGEPLALTPKEFQLLEFFLRHPGQVLAKELILDRLWGLEADVNIVETYVHFLRRKLDLHLRDRADDQRPFIETLRGVGYRLKGV